jgi:hypothetical protein
MALLGYEPDGDEPGSCDEWESATVDPRMATRRYQAFPSRIVTPRTDDAARSEMVASWPSATAGDSAMTVTSWGLPIDGEPAV